MLTGWAVPADDVTRRAPHHTTTSPPTLSTRPYFLFLLQI